MEVTKGLTAEELALIIWEMDSERQAELIRELSEVDEEWRILGQIDAVCNELSREKRLGKIRRFIAEFASRL